MIPPAKLEPEAALPASAPGPGARLRPRALLMGMLAVQILAALWFVGDATMDVMENPDGHSLLELPVALALGIGVVLGLREWRRARAVQARQDAALALAAGAFAQIVAAHFADWGLTRAERDVAMLALKGLDVAEIAAMRGAAQGTVRAQLARIYAKAEVSGRAQFAALFVEDLMQPVVPQATA